MNAKARDLGLSLGLLLASAAALASSDYRFAVLCVLLACAALAVPLFQRRTARLRKVDGAPREFGGVDAGVAWALCCAAAIVAAFIEITLSFVLDVSSDALPKASGLLFIGVFLVLLLTVRWRNARGA
jgi:hypothetical protein